MISKLAKRWCLLALLFSSSVIATPEQQDYSHIATPDLIDSAVALRSSNIEQLTAMIAELESRQLNGAEVSYLSYLQSYYLTLQGRFAEAESSLTALADETRSINVAVLVNISLVNVYTATANWSKGLSAANKLTKLITRLPESDNLHHYSTAILAQFFNNIEQYELGYKNAQKIVELDLKGRLGCAAGILSMNAANNLEIPLNDKSIIDTTLSSCSGMELLYLPSKLIVSERYLLTKQPQLIVDLLEPHLVEFEGSDTVLNFVEIHYLLASAYLQLNQVAQAEAMLERLTTLTEADVNLAKLADGYLLLADIRQNQGRTEQALSLMRQHLQLREQYLNKATSKRLAYQLAQQQISEKESEIQALHDKNELLKTQEDLLEAQRTNDRQFIVALCITVFLLGMFLYRSRSIQQKLKQLSAFDGLTAIHNRSQFMRLAERALSYAEDNKQAVSLVLFDLDQFQKVNDTYGHARGDWVLQQVAKACQQHTRRNDLLARTGGEEFCLLLLGCNDKRAIEVTEKFQQVIHTIDAGSPGFEATMTASFGITDNRLSGYGLDRLLGDAGAAVKMAKANGRDQLAVFAPDK
ncbi:GGDEF domain-containing protein [Neiella sp. HB171785]|uniref:diguanylate cyclase n=1 Tax=Neiella litorisoli TaxID=2771431 RepID=A0A8J6UPE3_9GAMM|nr:tetratricopeptide repeat-containing diguanylate cyclase [Neiella litorisoli]MBD1388112.1 GGDEF domain-containing protein [Neiella litorisoli]